MTVSANSYFSNAKVGTPGVGSGIDVHRVDTVPKYAVGFGFERADGATFRYCHNGASNTNRGVLVAPEDVGATQVEIGTIGALAVNLVKLGGENTNANNIGSRYMQLTITATALQYAGGYAVVCASTGMGYTYRIRNNSATNDPVTGDCWLELYDPIVVAVDSNSSIAIVGSRYANLVACNCAMATGSNAAVGVTCAGMTATNYGWIQTRGIVGVLQGAGLPVQGQQVQAASDVAGAVIAYTMTSATSIVANSVTNIVGYCVDPGDSTGHSTIMLMLE